MGEEDARAGGGRRKDANHKFVPVPPWDRVSCGTHRDKDLVQERSPDGRLRGSQSIRMH